MTRTAIETLCAAFLLASTVYAGDCESTAKSDKPDLVQTAVKAGQFQTLAAALQAADLVDALKGDGPFTVFAPTDAAFAKLPEGTVATLLRPENKAQLQAVLKYHVVAGKLDAAKVARKSGAVTLQGQRVPFRAKDGAVHVAGANVVKANIWCRNGVIHVIDSVILPESKNIVQVAAKAGSFKTLLAAAQAAGLAETLASKGPFTVFAPTDDAFAKLPEGTVANLLKPENKDQLVAVLTFHVVSGRVYSPAALKAGNATTLQSSPVTIRVENGVAKVENARILKTDIDASNGVIHVIDTVILPPLNKG